VQGLVEALPDAAIAMTTPLPTKKWTLYFASETGNGKRVAQGLEKSFKNNQIKTTLQPFSKANPQKFSNEGTLVFVISTHGEGDYPDSAKPLIQKLEKLNDGDLKGVEFLMIGLGDSAYSQFCGAAEKLQSLLILKGATALQNPTKLDVDFDNHLSTLYADFLQKYALNQGDGVNTFLQNMPAANQVSTKGYSRLSPLTGIIKEIINLNDRGSDRETYHIEIECEESLNYQAGDALGVILPPQADGSQPPPRLYSIASSARAFPNEIHLTVARAIYRKPDGTLGFGLCSNYLANLQPNDSIQFYIHRNENFRLPDNDDAEIIMVGAGTGIAPFRAFLQERAERGASGGNYLFFGNPHAHCDFLYQAEWQNHVENGLLKGIHLAFSRDQKQKIYVQHKLAEQGRAIVQALDNGAYFYVCGAKIPMSEDVEHTLLDLIMQNKDLSLDAAREYLENLAATDHYVKDVY
jgi:sulfite reductase (NADPH) flavoprotein alpha-component